MLRKRTVLIMGLGLHGGGAGAANYFTSRGERVVVTDLKTEQELGSGLEKLRHREKIRFVLGRHDFEDFRNADLIIKNPGVPPHSPYIEYARKLGVRIDTDVGIFLDRARTLTDNIVGVTGTKGKSTTAALIHAILTSRYPKALIAGNITVSVFDILKEVKHDSHIVLELSSFQLGGIRDKAYSPRVAVFTNFMEDHMNYYQSMEEYFEDKAVIFRYQKEGGILVINREDAVADLVQGHEGVRVVSFGMGGEFRGEGAFIKDGNIMYRRDAEEYRIMGSNSIPLQGVHNRYNVLAAIAAACAMGFEPGEIDVRVRGFGGLEHRLEYVTCRNNVHFYNDSAATTPDAAVSGIVSIVGPITLIAGGSDKGLKLRGFLDVITKRIKNLILLEGTGTQRLIREGLGSQYSLFDNLPDAVHHAFRVSEPGETVLLAPGFASFGMFSNEFERGKAYKELVLSL